MLFRSALAQIARQRAQGYRMFGIVTRDENNVEKIPSFVGFRYGEYLACGKIIYIDDLSTEAAARGQGHASMLLDHVTQLAREMGCDAVELDSGYTRNTAHRLYLNKGYDLVSHHFALNLKKAAR